MDGADLAKLEKVIVREIEKIFGNLLKGPEKWAKWVNKGAVEGFKDAKQAAKAIQGVYKKSAKDTAKALKSAGYAAQDVGDAVADTYKISKKAMTKALKDAGYAAKTAEKVTSKAFKNVGKSIEKGAKDVGKAIGKLFE